MAERQRRKPSNKIKPGTPHPTKANVVRGYDGRWVSKKHFETVTKARKGAERIKAEVKAKAKKGGALVKQAKGAVTKVAKGNLLKIRKGDRGIVRAIKDTYKLGQDTRKSADAVYKAGKTTRKVHDQLVKGGKEFAKGTVEAGKATRRAYERLRPGGKIVKSKGSKIAKYKKPPSKIVKSPGGKVVRSPGGKVVKSPGGKVVKSPGGKLSVRKTVEDKSYKAPKVDKPLRAKTKTGRVVQKTAGQARKAARETAKKVRETKAVSNLNKAKLGKDSLKVRAAKTTKYLRSLKPKTIAKGLKSGAKGLAVGVAADWLADQAVDRTFRAISGKNKMSLKEFRTERDRRLENARKGQKFKTWKDEDAYKGPKQPEIKFDDKKTTSKKDIKIKSKKTDKQVSVGNMVGATATVPKKKRMGAIEKRNREIHGNKKIDDLKDYHKRWKAARKAGRLKEFKEKEKKKRMNA
tara:strand:- start:209 stop:1597 length:1389 start_codon:yes stop_codon:yes gene_type:complete